MLRRVLHLAARVRSLMSLTTSCLPGGYKMSGMRADVVAVVKLLSKRCRIPNLLVKGGLSHERPSEAWAPRSPHNDGLGLAVPTAHIFLNLLVLSLTLNFTSIQESRSNRCLQSFEKRKCQLASMTCGHRLPLYGCRI